MAIYHQQDIDLIDILSKYRCNTEDKDTKVKTKVNIYRYSLIFLRNITIFIDVYRKKYYPELCSDSSWVYIHTCVGTYYEDSLSETVMPTHIHSACAMRCGFGI